MTHDQEIELRRYFYKNFKIGLKAPDFRFIEQVVKGYRSEQGISDKMKEFEAEVDAFIEEHDRKPTYAELARRKGVHMKTAYKNTQHLRNFLSEEKNHTVVKGKRSDVKPRK